MDDCCLENGAIVAANSDREDYPHEAQCYRYVWPRDAAYVCYALQVQKKSEAQAKFFRWLKRAEDISSGILCQNYYTNGRKRWLALQPDQNGSVLWALHNFLKHNPQYREEFMPIVSLLADGLCSIWNKDRFRAITQDLWEERFAYPEMGHVHTYSLAACCHGLKCACDLEHNSRWEKAAKEMQARIEECTTDGCFVRMHGTTSDTCPDISLLGLVWPFKVIRPDDERMHNTVSLMHKFLEKDGLFRRYHYDMFDGFRFQGQNAKRGAGYWPLASFWMSIYYSMKGEKTEYIEKAMKRVDKVIPEQFFDNDIQVSVKPLAWSHAMHIIARNGNADAGP